MNAHASKPPRLQEVAFADIAKVKVLIVPDGHKAPRKMFGNVRLRLKRSTVARLFREWRLEGGKVRDRQPLASLLLWLAIAGIEVQQAKK